MSRNKVLKGGVYQSLPDTIYRKYKSGELNKYLPKGKPNSSDTNDDIIKAYNTWKKCQLQPMPPSTPSASNKSAERSAWDLWNFLHNSNINPDEMVKETPKEGVNTPLAYEAAVNAGILPTLEEMAPYLITIDQNSGSQDYIKLREMGVQGVCIDIGCYYTIIHTVNTPFRQPRLESQVKECIDANIPFGLFTTVRARSISEANNELEEMKLAIRKFPPMVGFWLKLGLTQSQNTNNMILSHYYNELYKLGLYDQLGIYSSKSQLKQISWSKFYNTFYLWLNDHVNKVEDIPHPITPEFFLCRDVS